MLYLLGLRQKKWNQGQIPVSEEWLFSEKKNITLWFYIVSANEKQLEPCVKRVKGPPLKFSKKAFMGLLNMLGNLSFKALSICIYFTNKIKKIHTKINSNITISWYRYYLTLLDIAVIRKHLPLLHINHHVAHFPLLWDTIFNP